MLKKLNLDDIAHLAKLANVSIDEADRAELVPQINAILENVAEIKGLDLASLPETNQVTQKTNEFRPDTVTPSLSQEEALSMAAHTHNGFFVVNQLIDHDRI